MLTEQLHRFNARKIARRLIPPIIFDLKHLFQKAEWEFVGTQWPENDGRASGWDDPSVVRTLIEKWTAYKRAVDSTGPLAFAPWSTEAFSFYTHNLIMSYGFVLARAAHNKQTLAVLDWGGSMGHYAALGTALLPEVFLDFTVKERPSICEAGRQLLPGVSFNSSDQVFSRRYDLVMALGSLQYEVDWRSTARRLAGASGAFLFIVAPVLEKPPSFVVVQRPFYTGMNTEYISWVFDHGELIKCLSDSGFMLDREFLCADRRQHYRNAVASSQNLGFLFRRA